MSTRNELKFMQQRKKLSRSQSFDRKISTSKENQEEERPPSPDLEIAPKLPEKIVFETIENSINTEKIEEENNNENTDIQYAEVVCINSCKKHSKIICLCCYRFIFVIFAFIALVIFYQIFVAINNYTSQNTNSTELHI
tara:strand:+ start:170 stop:586 length:417 start_codon:yes stop_codon:yes gene_type:complete